MRKVGDIRTAFQKNSSGSSRFLWRLRTAWVNFVGTDCKSALSLSTYPSDRDQILNYENIVPEDVTIIDKPDFEKLHLINQLDEDDKTTVFKIVDTMLTKKKFKDFFAKNVAML